MISTSPIPPEMSDKPKRRKLSLHGLTESFSINLARWPLTVVYLCLVAMWMLIEIWYDGLVISNNFELATPYLFGEGALLSLAVSIWCDFLGYRRYILHAQIAANTLLFIDYIYLLFNATALGNAGMIARGAITTALIVAVIFMPPRRGNDGRAWFYSYAQISNIVTTWLVAVVMSVALSIIYSTLEMLFDIRSTNTYVTTLVLGAFFIPAMLLLYRIPTPDELIHNEAEYTPTRFTVGLVKYLLCPLAAIYMAILYIYGIRILATLEWPRGMVSYAVSGMTAVTVLLCFLLESVCRRGTEPFFAKVRRFMPLAIIPLLTMMSVAIGMRINQYGITAARLYLLAFNIWAYAAMLWLGLARGRRFNIIPASFAAVFLLVSIVPGANFTAITHSHMRSQVFSTLRSLGVQTFPISQEQAIELHKTADSDIWQSLGSQLRYLDSSDDHSLVADIVDFPVQISSWEYADVFSERYCDNDEDCIEFKLDDRNDAQVTIPDGFTRVQYINKYEYRADSCSYGNFNITLADGYSITINPAILHKQDSLQPIPVDAKGSATFRPTYIQCRYTPGPAKLNSLNIEGYLFTNPEK